MQRVWEELENVCCNKQVFCFLLKSPNMCSGWYSFAIVYETKMTLENELPQLLNIIKGELSIIGPRPVIEEELEKYGDNKKKFLSVTPGLTGYWAANGRSCTSYEERMNFPI